MRIRACFEKARCAHTHTYPPATSRVINSVPQTLQYFIIILLHIALTFSPKHVVAGAAGIFESVFQCTRLLDTYPLNTSSSPCRRRSSYNTPRKTRALLFDRADTTVYRNNNTFLQLQCVYYNTRCRKFAAKLFS